MQNEERRRNIIFEYGEQHADKDKKENENNDDGNSVAGKDELQRKIDIECYDKVMESYPNYFSTVYAHVQRFKQKLAITKMKSILKNINIKMIFIVL